MGDSADLIGTWNAVSVNYTGTTVTEANGVSVQADFVGEGQNIDYTLNFSSNPNELTSDGSYDIELTTTFLNETTTQTFTDIEFASTGEWLLDGDQMTVTSEGVTTIVTVVELTGTSLILNIIDVQTQTANGTTITITTDSTLVYNR